MEKQELFILVGLVIAVFVMCTDDVAIMNVVTGAWLRGECSWDDVRETLGAAS